MEGQGDDGINVHGIFHDVRSGPIHLTKRRITMLIGAKPLVRATKLWLGEEYEFRHRMTWAVEGRARLLSHHDYGNGTSRATFEFGTGADASISQFALLHSLARSPRVTIRDSYFGNNRARGALLKTSNVLVTEAFDHPKSHWPRRIRMAAIGMSQGPFTTGRSSTIPLSAATRDSAMRMYS